MAKSYDVCKYVSLTHVAFWDLSEGAWTQFSGYSSDLQVLVDNREDGGNGGLWIRSALTGIWGRAL